MKATPGQSNTYGPWLVRVPGWTPPSENEFVGRHWKIKETIKKSVANLLGVYARLSGVKLVTHDYRPVRRVTFTCVFDTTIPDPHNLFKLTLDALRLARVIVDDSDRWLECPLPVLQKGERAETVFEVLDLKLGDPIRPEDDPDVKRFLGRMRAKGKDGVRGPEA